MSSIEAPQEPIFVSLKPKNEDSELSRYLSGNVLEWIRRRAIGLGDLIVPKIVYVEPVENEVHKVFWVEHKGTNPLTGEDFHNHHVVCDCVLHRNFNDGNGGIDTSQCQTDSMNNALKARGKVASSLGQAQSADYRETGAVNLQTAQSTILEVNEFDLEAMEAMRMEEALRSDHLHPELWHGNALSGGFNLDESSVIINKPVAQTIKVVRLLERRGKAVFDGETVRLAA